MTPRLTIAVPAYNAERYLRETLDSVAAQRDAPPMRVVVVDDASTDSTGDIACAHPVVDHVQRCEVNLGLAGALNECLSAAATEYVLLLNADDLIDPGYASTMTRTLDDAPQAALAACRVRFVDTNGRVRGTQRCPFADGVVDDFVARMALGCELHTPSVVARRRIYDRVGKFTPAMSYSPDYDMWVRIGAAAPVVFVRRTLASYRVHEANITQTIGIARIVGEEAAVLGRIQDLMCFPDLVQTRLLDHAAARHLQMLVPSAMAGLDVEDAIGAVRAYHPGVERLRELRLLRRADRWPGPAAARIATLNAALTASRFARHLQLRRFSAIGDLARRLSR